MVTLTNPISKSFSVYGVEILVQSAFPLDWLVQDFAFFQTETPQPIIARLELVIRPKKEAKTIPPGKKLQFPECTVVKKSNERWIDYHGAALLEAPFVGPRATLYCDDPDLTQEIAYLYLQSRLGEIWDSRWTHRIHCLSLRYQGKTGLLLLPSGGGKSTLALELLQKSEVEVLGDDLCLVDANGKLWPYPLRFSFRAETEIPYPFTLWKRRKYGAKKLVSTSALSIPHGLQALSCDFLIAAERGDHDVLRGASRFELLVALFLELVIGIGLPQVRELILTQGPRHTLGLALVALRRFRVSILLVKNARCLHFRMGRIPKDSADALVGALHSLTMKE